MKFLNEDNKMPIIGYFGPNTHTYVSPKGWKSPEYITEQSFQMIQESGINLISHFEVDYAKDPQMVLKALELGEKYNICMYVNDSEIKKGMTIEQMTERMKGYNHFRSFKGITVCDEPGTPEFGHKARLMEDYYDICNKINSFDNLNAFVNLFAYHPDWIGVDNNSLWLGRPFFEEYVDTYCKCCSAKMISEDYYIFDAHSVENSKDYFENLEIMNHYAQKYDIPYWVHIQLGGQWNDAAKEKETEDYYPHPCEVIWNVNTSLACGAKGIAYFPLMQPLHFAYAPNGEMDFKRNGLITADGNKSAWFEAVRKANQQIQAVGGYLLNMKLRQLVVKGHYAKLNLPNAAQAYEELQSVVLGDELNPYGVIIGCFEYEDKHAFYVVNNDVRRSQDAVLHFDKSYPVTIVSAQTNEKMNTDTCALKLEQSDAVLVMID